MARNRAARGAGVSGAVESAEAIEGFRAPRVTAAADALGGGVLRGQGAALARVRAGLEAGALHHAWMLRGPRGVGKATLAFRLAIDLLSAEGAEPVESVAPKLAAGAHPRLLTLARGWNDKTKKLRATISVDDARRLSQFFALSAADGGWRVAVIDAADELGREAANALLKAIEEPPARAVVFIIDHGERAAPPTIASRCVKLPVGGLAAEEAVAALDAAALERVDRAAAERLAMLAAVDGGGRVSPGRLAQLLAADAEAVYDEILGLLLRAPNPGAERLDRLAQSLGRGPGARKFAALRTLLPLACERLARAGATGDHAALTAAERRVAEAQAGDLAAAQAWAARVVVIRDAFAAQSALNLDPGRTVLDIFTRMQEEAGARRFE